MTSTTFFSLQGEGWIGDNSTAPDTDDNGMVMQSQGLLPMGDLNPIDLQLNMDQYSRREHMTGLRQQVLRMTTARTGELTLGMTDDRYNNMAIAFQARRFLVSPGTLTGVPIITTHPTVPGAWKKITTLPLPGFAYYFGYQDAEGDWRPYKNVNTSTAVVKDSYSSPNTVSNTYYTIKSRSGMITFNDLSGISNITAPIKGDIQVGLVTNKLTPDIRYGRAYPLEFQNVSNVVVKDSAGTPATVTSTFYTVDNTYGEITFPASQKTAFEAANYTMPLQVQYTYGNATHFPFLTLPSSKEYWFRFKGLNTANNNAPCMVDLYRGVITPINQMSFINDETGIVTLKFSLLADLNKEPDGIMGQLGRYIRL